jgi:uncharacterized RDD family membrane protein YckC
MRRPLDRNIDVRTPESVALRYELAGLGSRFLALVIDQLLQIAILAAVFATAFSLLTRVSVARAAAGAPGMKFAESIAIAFVVVVVFAAFFGYFIAFETLWNGQTPGKRAVGIRVVRDGGYPVDFGAALIRNLIRVGEMALGYYAVSAVSMLLSDENKRLGDYAAGTIVVRDARLELGSAAATAAPVYAPTLYLSGEERALIKRFLERRDALAPEKRQELAGRLASRVRERVPIDLCRLEDESLLERL